MNAQRIVVTGGAGFIGSHVCVALLNAGRDILVIDNFDNSSPIALARIEELTGKRFDVLEADLSDATQTAKIHAEIRQFQPDGAIHLAGLKAVGESVADPVRYYRVNIGATLTLIDALDAANAKMLVFSSSATVYGDLNQSPVREDGKTGPTNPYGRTKHFIEEILKDKAHSDTEWKICNLRYFNPVGAHPSGRIGEDPAGVPNNLFPFIAQVAVGRREKLNIYGDDYPTPDGTGVRDYIHVVDLARGHLDAMDHVSKPTSPSATDINLGASKGVSVLEAVSAFKRASNRDVPYEIVDRRPGDVAEIVADAQKAKKVLGWSAEKTIDDMCKDHWRWQNQNPNGYEK